MQQEYWINVYKFNDEYTFGHKYTSKDSVKLAFNEEVLYRIHVKMKPKKADKPQYGIMGDKFNWME